MLDSTFNGTIWGSGLIREGEINLPHANVIALRGKLSLECLRHPSKKSVALGDPGILVSAFEKRRPSITKIGVIRHFTHGSSITSPDITWTGVQSIDVQQSCSKVIRQIAACQTVITSSLHGLVIADSFGIPAAWMIEPNSTVDPFKFRDYESVVNAGGTREWRGTLEEFVSSHGRHATPADPSRVNESIFNLLRSLSN